LRDHRDAAAQYFALISMSWQRTPQSTVRCLCQRGTSQSKVRSTCKSAEDEFSFLWQERGGPTAATPIRRGFGSAVLIDAAKTALEYPPSGVRYELVIPLSTIQAKVTAETPVSKGIT
jgi:hypothetical protein